MEQEFEVEAYGVDAKCEVCGSIMMQEGKVMWMTDPPKIPHKCPECGHEAAYTDRYPTVRYRRKVPVVIHVKEGIDLNLTSV